MCRCSFSDDTPDVATSVASDGKSSGEVPITPVSEFLLGSIPEGEGENFCYLQIQRNNIKYIWV